MLKDLKQRFTNLIKSGKQTDYKLNFLTLHIESEEIRKDLSQHNIDQKIMIFWVSNVLTFLNMIAGIFTYF